MKNEKIWFNGIMGVVVGDALGLPVQFKCRELMEWQPLKGMIGYGTFDMPEGSWSDDSSLMLAALDSIRACGDVDCEDIMERFVDWLECGRYTPFGRPYDIGLTCMKAIQTYEKCPDVERCGVTGERANGNGALMWIMPVCLWAYEQVKDGLLTEAEVLDRIHRVAALTHNHLRSHMACGMYYFMVKNVLDGEGLLHNCLQAGIDEAAMWYQRDAEDLEQMQYYRRLLDLETFGALPKTRIQSSGYVVDTIEAAVWCLINTDSYQACMLKAVNLGEDTDTIAAIAGGLAGLYYGCEGIPEEWLEVIQRREWIEDMVLQERQALPR